MRALRCPKCHSTRITVRERLHYHHTAFGRPGRAVLLAVTSKVRCEACFHSWRTASKAADTLPDAFSWDRCCPGLTDEDLQEAKERR